MRERPLPRAFNSSERSSAPNRSEFRFFCRCSGGFLDPYFVSCSEIFAALSLVWLDVFVHARRAMRSTSVDEGPTAKN